MQTRDQEVKSKFLNARISRSAQIVRRRTGVRFDFVAKGGGPDHAPACRMINNSDKVDAVAERVIGCAIEVHRTMGPGLLESIYQECLMLELGDQALAIECGRHVPVDYKARRLKAHFFIDIVVEQCLIIEAKAVEMIKPVHKAQVINYLKLTGCPAGLLINFHETTLKAGLHRLNHPERYARLKLGSSADVPTTE